MDRVAQPFRRTSHAVRVVGFPDFERAGMLSVADRAKLLIPAFEQGGCQTYLLGSAVRQDAEEAAQPDLLRYVREAHKAPSVPAFTPGPDPYSPAAAHASGPCTAYGPRNATPACAAGIAGTTPLQQPSATAVAALSKAHGQALRLQPHAMVGQHIAAAAVLPPCKAAEGVHAKSLSSVRLSGTAVAAAGSATWEGRPLGSSRGSSSALPGAERCRPVDQASTGAVGCRQASDSSDVSGSGSSSGHSREEPPLAGPCPGPRPVGSSPATHLAARDPAVGLAAASAGCAGMAQATGTAAPSATVVAAASVALPKQRTEALHSRQAGVDGVPDKPTRVSPFGQGVLSLQLGSAEAAAGPGLCSQHVSMLLQGRGGSGVMAGDAPRWGACSGRSRSFGSGSSSRGASRNAHVRRVRFASPPGSATQPLEHPPQRQGQHLQRQHQQQQPNVWLCQGGSPAGDPDPSAPWAPMLAVQQSRMNAPAGCHAALRTAPSWDRVDQLLEDAWFGVPLEPADDPTIPCDMSVHSGLWLEEEGETLASWACLRH